MGELTMPRTEAEMQGLAEFYQEALGVGSFDDSLTGMPVFARHDDVKVVMGTPQVFGNEYPGHPEVPGTLAPRFSMAEGPLRRAIGLFSEIPPNTAGSDRREHEENRGVMEELMPIGHGKARAEVGKDWESRIAAFMERGLVAQLAEGTPEEISAALGGVAAQGEVDIMPGVRELTMGWIADYLGISRSEAVRRALLGGAADQVALLGSPITESQQHACLGGFEQLWDIHRDLADQAVPADAGNYTERSLEYRLARLQDKSPEAIAEARRQVAGADINLTVAGFATLADSLSSGVRWMGEHPEDWLAAKNNIDQMDRYGRELLRLCGGIYAWPKVVLQETELNGRKLVAGTPVLALLGAANRDPRHYGDAPEQDPTKLIPNRAVKSDLVFGSSVRGRENRNKSHFCVGAGIAQVAMTAFFAALARKHPDFRLTQPNPPLKHNVLFLEQASLPIALR
jgi:cytochrome P450